jgi:hypothetical protein
MASSAARPIWLELMRFTPCTPYELEQLKLDRLNELRAAIDALRCEQRATDPLLAWVMELENGGKTGIP